MLNPTPVRSGLIPPPTEKSQLCTPKTNEPEELKFCDFSDIFRGTPHTFLNPAAFLCVDFFLRFGLSLDGFRYSQ